MKKYMVGLIIITLLVFSGVGTALAGNPNPGVIPNISPMNGDAAYGSELYRSLSARWWQWALSFAAADLPFFNTGGAVDISAHQSGNVWFLAGANNGLTEPRTGTVPSGKSLFFPMVNLNNDYPCPDPTFQPGPTQTLEQFLQETGNYFLDQYFAPDPAGLFAEIDGVTLTGLTAYRATSALFTFTADPALAGFYDACITGTPQSGVSVGYWILLPPLTTGTHTLHFGLNSAGGNFPQDITYNLTVTPGD